MNEWNLFPENSGQTVYGSSVELVHIEFHGLSRLEWVTRSLPQEGIISHSRWLWSTMWLLGFELRNFEKAGNTLKHWDIFLLNYTHTYIIPLKDIFRMKKTSHLPRYREFCNRKNDQKSKDILNILLQILIILFRIIKFWKYTVVRETV